MQLIWYNLTEYGEQMAWLRYGVRDVALPGLVIPVLFPLKLTARLWYEKQLTSSVTCK